ncbi:uncharacterized protein FA14DRAFT_170035 [Meira miltonrushii]|uniref:Guided entry of tail-anchored proteins 1 n=1 Tax=Meira miltonrushii TaxID=1280837 RepID=A0A316VHY8_9BASI|nr:uncharacterized protein FA14DRAFT_170035 [Meira miltonrushii]PWN37150.1 hypothetical protein FA14DRAFT_170035 [Meira miltonrushii]
MHPALIILSVVVTVHIINLIGRERIESALKPFYLRLFNAKDLQQQRQLKKDLFSTRQQLNLTSSQDEFAKWAKLRRSVDKHVAQLEATNARLAGASSSVSLLVRAVLFLGTTLFPFCLTFYFGKTPMFFLPPSGSPTVASSAARISYLPTRKAPGGFEIPHDATHAWSMVNETYLGPLGWLLAMTAAPRGSVSAGMWSTICTRVILLITKQIKDLFVALTYSDPIAAEKKSASTQNEKVEAKATSSAIDEKTDSSARKRNVATTASD